MAPAGGPGREGLLDAFRKPDFDVAAFVRDATGHGADKVARLSQQLEESSSSLDEELQREIVACHDELLQSASSISDLDGQLGDVREVVEALKKSIARVKGDVLTPFQSVKKKVELLERMQGVNVLIRKLLRFLFDARKLRTQMDSSAKDFSKAAQTLHELETALQESSLERVDMLREEVAWIRESGARVRKQAEQDLREGVRQGNQMTIGVALQVFFNMQCLWPQLKKLTWELLEELGRAALPPGSVTAATGAAGFHQALEVHLQVLVNHTQRVHLLDELLRSKTDPVTQRTFCSVLEAEGVASLTGHFWSEATSALRMKFARLTQDRTTKRALILECPKVLKVFAEAADKVNLGGRGRGQAVRTTEREALMAVVADLRNEFLAESIRRVMEPVEMMLPDKLLASLSATGEQARAGAGYGAAEKNITDELPTSHDLRRYAQLLVAELERCECCPELLLREAVRGVRSSVLMFATRLEQAIDNTALELRCFEDEEKLRPHAPLPSPSAGHARNARLFGIAHHTLAALQETVPARFQASVVTEKVQSTLQQTQASLVSPMFAGLRRAMVTSAVRPGGVLEDRTADGSTAVLAVAQVCAHAARFYFSLFGSGQLLPLLKELCVFQVRTFLSGVLVMKPCNAQVRAALAQDAQTVEAALSALVPDFRVHIPHEASVFAAFRKLLAAPAIEAVDLEAVAVNLPSHLLLAFLVNQLPPEVPAVPAIYGVSPRACLEEHLLLLWDEQPAALAAFKAKIAALLDKHDLDPSASTVIAFLMAQSGE